MYGHSQKVHFDLHLKEKLMPNDCHTYYVPNLHDFHIEMIQTFLSIQNM
jgi:hypothetical protein